MDLASRPGRDLSRDISQGEATEKELDAFINRRHEQRVKSEGERAVEEAWRASERRQEARRQAEMDRGRLAMCRHLQGVYARRSEEWGRQGDKLERTGEGGCIADASMCRH